MKESAILRNDQMKDSQIDELCLKDLVKLIFLRNS